MLTLITFEGCPNSSRIVSLLEDMGVEFSKIDQSLLPADHPFRHYSSPTLLRNGTILFGSHTDGESGCSLSLPSDEAIRMLLRDLRKNHSH